MPCSLLPYQGANYQLPIPLLLLSVLRSSNYDFPRIRIERVFGGGVERKGGICLPRNGEVTFCIPANGRIYSTLGVCANYLAPD